MSDPRSTVVGGPTPRIDSETECAACPGLWVYDEVFGWIHNPGPQPDCVAPSPTTRATAICG